MRKFGALGTIITPGTDTDRSGEPKTALRHIPSERAAAPFEINCLISCVPLFQLLLLKIIILINTDIGHANMQIPAYRDNLDLGNTVRRKCHERKDN